MIRVLLLVESALDVVPLLCYVVPVLLYDDAVACLLGLVLVGGAPDDDGALLVALVARVLSGSSVRLKRCTQRIVGEQGIVTS